MRKRRGRCEGCGEERRQDDWGGGTECEGEVLSAAGLVRSAAGGEYRWQRVQAGERV